jgi:hypothetical protein
MTPPRGRTPPFDWAPCVPKEAARWRCRPKPSAAAGGSFMSAAMAKSTNPFRGFDFSPEVIRLVVMAYVRYPLSLWNVEDLLFERGIDIRHETVRLWRNRFGPMFPGEIRGKRLDRRRAHAGLVRLSVGEQPRRIHQPPGADGGEPSAEVSRSRSRRAGLRASWRWPSPGRTGRPCAKRLGRCPCH